MIVLIAIGLAAGVGTALTPCVLPVLPALLAGGASGRKPLRIIAGLVLSFSVFTLFASWLLSTLGLPQDLLRNLAIAFLFLMAVVLLLPPAALAVERALAFFSRLRPANGGGGFVLGVSLGLVFVPCAGPFLAAITTAAARHHFGARTIAATLAYAVGAAIPMSIIARGGREAAARIRASAGAVRATSGFLVAVVALGLVFHLDDRLTNVSAPWTSWLQRHVEATASARRQLAKVSGEHTTLRARASSSGLPDYGQAPPIRADGAWINSKPLTLRQLHGKVVLLDFWTYSCINCLRTIPHLRAWWNAYRKDGLVIVGVHTPEFAFEHVTSNVRAAVKRLGVTWPVVQDNRYRTWDNYGNEYWPAEYLIDRNGDVRETTVGETDYAQTERTIRRLLGVAGPTTHVPNRTPNEVTTPETYLGWARLADYVGTDIHQSVFGPYTPPKRLPENDVSYGGTWKVGPQQVVAGRGAEILLHFHAKDVYIVLGGHGTVHVTLDGRPAGRLHVEADRLYTVRSSNAVGDGLLQLRFTPGVQAYSFTFG
ncbi:MAG TPA: cytochrome c biogenesis protein DipZ [Gaiellaceae bacterium]|nr:cytochrome c biogenesis protein DipZ [Gaiellaceae bacterium]